MEGKIYVKSTPIKNKTRLSVFQILKLAMIRLKFIIPLLFTLLFLNSSLGQSSLDYKLTKLSLSLTGKVPSENEKIFFQNLKEGDRKVVFVDSLFNNKDFYLFVQGKLMEDLLEGTSIDYLYEQAKDYYFLSSTRKQSVYQSQFKADFESIDYLGKISLGRFEKENVSIREIYKNTLLSPLYDKLNMGSLNFAVSVFQHLFNRKPTSAELNESIKIIEGHYGQLFNLTGSSKLDFVNLMLENREFKENQIRYWYLHLFNEMIEEQDLIKIVIIDYNTSEDLLKRLALKLWDEN